jgi:uridine kinase
MKFDKIVDRLLNETQQHNLMLILIRGISGSGKTTYAKKLMK